MNKLNLFQKTAIATLLATIFLIFVGGLVRVTGAGLGCPDWPTCWGKWWPPSSVEEIPVAPEPDPEKGPYYEGHRVKTLDDGTVVRSRHYVSEFNHAKLWTEYINRLLGVLIGLFIVTTFVLSIPYRKSKPEITLASFVAVLLVGFEGWLGALVVRSKLMPGMITLHMAVAIVLMCLLLWIVFRAMEDRLRPRMSGADTRKIAIIALIMLGVTIIQILLGSQVREALHYVKEAAADSELERPKWIDQVGIMDHTHRSFSWITLAAGWFLLLKLYFAPSPGGLLKTTSGAIFLLLILQIIYGIILAYFGLPPLFQILHQGFASLLICAEFLLVLMTFPGLRRRRREAAAA